MERQPFGTWQALPLPAGEVLVDGAARYVKAAFDDIDERPFGGTVKIQAPDGSGRPGPRGGGPVLPPSHPGARGMSPQQGTGPVDPVRAALLSARGWTILGAGFTLLPAISALGWVVAQARGYQDSFRGFDAGDPFPWYVLAPVAFFGVFSVVRAVVAWSATWRCAGRHSAAEAVQAA